MGDKAKRVIAIIGVVFMVIFSISIVFVFVDPKMLNGAFGYIALLSAIAGAACFVVVKYVFREEKGYLPKEDENNDQAKDSAKVDKDGDKTVAEEKASEESEITSDEKAEADRKGESGEEE